MCVCVYTSRDVSAVSPCFISASCEYMLVYTSYLLNYPQAATIPCSPFSTSQYFALKLFLVGINSMCTLAHLLTNAFLLPCSVSLPGKAPACVCTRLVGEMGQHFKAGECIRPKGDASSFTASGQKPAW